MEDGQYVNNLPVITNVFKLCTITTEEISARV